MKLWARVFLGYFVIVGLAGWFVLNVFVHEVKPGVRETVEDVMVDTANLLAELVADEMPRPPALGLNPNGRFASSVQRYRNRSVKAPIWGLEKQTLDFRIYVTDASGIVVYDSGGTAVGSDYSRWRDVVRTLRGEYGARASRDDPLDDGSTVLHVAAPVRQGEQTVGVVTVAKPARTLAPIIERSERKVFRAGAILLLVASLLGAAFTTWLTLSFNKLVRYAQKLAHGEKADPPSRGKDEIGELSRALAKLRDEVDGRAYVEHYVQHLTHEMKSPLAAIRGAAELLQEPLPENDRRHFAELVLTQGQRLQSMIDRLLQLARLEQQRSLGPTASVDLTELINEACAAVQPRLAQRKLDHPLRGGSGPAITVQGDRFLLLQALSNLLDNALAFTATDGVITVRLLSHDGRAAIVVSDNGAGIPAYAGTQIFERFYSLPRPDGSSRSTGLGLPLVREVAQLHGGAICLRSAAAVTGHTPAEPLHIAAGQDLPDCEAWIDAIAPHPDQHHPGTEAWLIVRSQAVPRKA